MLRLRQVLPFLLLAGCAVRQPSPRTWRFAERTLIPPGVTSPEATQGTFKASIALRRDCLGSDAFTIQRRRSRIIVTVHREALLRQPRGWLTQWVERAESEGCIPLGQGDLLAAGILESLPLPAGAELRLRRADGMPNFVEISAGNRLQVISPIVREGTAPGLLVDGLMRVSGEGDKIQVEIHSSPDLLGVETAWYEVEPKSKGPGCVIVPVSAEVNLRGKVQIRESPATNYFQFGPEIGFYRLFYKADQSEVLALATSRAALPNDPDACAVCFNVPKGVGVNPYMKIEVNGSATPVPIGATVRAVLQAAKQRPEAVLPTLAITKPYGGRPAPVEFDHSKQDILNLVLTGNERIRW